LIKNRRFYTVKKIIPLFLSLLLLAGLLAACPQPATETELSGQLQIFNAGSLTAPFEQISDEFNKIHPNVEILAEAAGSATTIRKVTELGKECGVIGSADYLLIPELMFPDYADWYIIFASNEMCICYTDQSRFADEINGNNWYEILQRDGVTYGRSDPDQDPCGYRTLLVFQLAQSYYHDNTSEFGLTPDPNADGLYDALAPGTEHERGRTGGTSEIRTSEEVVSAKSVDLITALEAGDLDYAFEYFSVAMQHGLNFIELDDHINLSKTSAEIAGVEEFYGTASIEIKKEDAYAAQYGGAIVYGITIPVNAENGELAAEFIELLLSATVKQIMEVENGQPMLDPPLCDHPENLPALLKEAL